MSNAYLPSWCKSILVFGPSQLVNFSVVPVPHRMLFMQCVGLGWNTFLSFANNRSNAALAQKVVAGVERVEEEMEHAVERVEEGLVKGVLKVAEKIPHGEQGASSSRNAKASNYIASSPLESEESTTATTGPPQPERTAHTAPSLHRYEEMLADELKYQEELYPSVDDVPGCMTLL